MDPGPESRSFVLGTWRELPLPEGPLLDFVGHMTCLLDGVRVFFELD